jgi:hypothetical protein
MELQTQIMWLQWSISSEVNGPFYTAGALKAAFRFLNTSFYIRIDPQRLITFTSLFFGGEGGGEYMNEHNFMKALFLD